MPHFTREGGRGCEGRDNEKETEYRVRMRRDYLCSKLYVGGCLSEGLVVWGGINTY